MMFIGTEDTNSKGLQAVSCVWWKAEWDYMVIQAACKEGWVDMRAMSIKDK